MRAAAGDDDVAAEAAWTAVSTILSRSGKKAQNRARLVDANAREVAATTLRRSDVTGATVVACLRAVSRMFSNEHNTCSGEDGCDAAVGAGMVIAIVVAMRRMAGSVDVTTWGCQVLSDLHVDASVTETRAVDAPVKDAVLTAMRRYGGAVSVQQFGCRALREWHLGGVAGVLEGVVAAMERQPDSAPVQQEACLALHCHCFIGGDAPTRNPAGLAAAAAAVVSAMRRHTDDAGVQESGVRALSANSASSSAAGCADVVLAAMRSYADVAKIQQAGCAFLSRLWCAGAQAAAISGSELALTALRRHADDAGVQSDACSALVVMCAPDTPESERVRAALVRGGGIESVLSALRRHGDDANVQGRGCILLACLIDHVVAPALAGANRVAIASGGGIDAILGAMRRHADDAVVQHNGAFALTRLAVKNDDNLAAMIRAGSVEVVVSAMSRVADAKLPSGVQECLLALRTMRDVIGASTAVTGRQQAAAGVKAVLADMQQYEDDAAVQNRALDALAVMTLNRADAEAVVSAGGIKVIVAMMQRHPQSRAVQSSGCIVLSQLCIEGAAAEKAIVRCGGEGAVLAAMSRYLDDAFVQAAACQALDRLHIASRECGEAALAAMRRHADDAGVQELALRALLYSAEGSAGAAALVHAGAVEVVVAAMRRFAETSTSIADIGSDVLTTLAAKASSQAAIVRAGGVEVVLGGMRRHADDAGVQERGSEALCELLMSTGAMLPESVVRVGTGAVEVALRAVRNHPGSAAIQFACMCLLDGLVEHADAKVAMLHGGGVEAVVAALVRHRDDARVQEGGCRVLATLTAEADSALCDAIIGTGATDALLTALQRHPDVHAVQERSCAALARLACRPAAREIASRSGGIGIVVAAMRRHLKQHCACVQVYGMDALICLACSETSKSAAVDGGGLDAAVAAMRHHEGNADVQLLGCKLLASLALEPMTRDAVAARGIDAVRQALRRHPTAAPVIMLFLATMSALSSGAEGERRVDVATELAAVLPAEDAARWQSVVKLLLDPAAGDIAAALYHMTCSRD
jgi:hypothetical protein